MISKVINFVENPNDLIELYCGVGTFTLPLSKVFKNVFATENNRNAYRCLLKAIQKNNIEIILFNSKKIIKIAKVKDLLPFFFIESKLKK